MLRTLILGLFVKWIQILTHVNILFKILDCTGNFNKELFGMGK